MGHCQKPITPLGNSNCKIYPNSLCYDAQYDSGIYFKFGPRKHVW
jgi:hypothetical protein